MRLANATSLTNSAENIVTICPAEAPSTLRTPISFVRRWAEIVARPNRPKQHTTIASNEEMPAILLRRSSFR